MTGAPVELDLDALQSAVRELHDEGALIVHAGQAPVGDWLDLLNAFVLAQVSASGYRQIFAGAPLWELRINGPVPVLKRITSLPTGDLTVLAPTARVNLTVRALLGLYRSGVCELWSLDDGRWMRQDVETALAELMYQRRIKPILRKISPGMLASNRAVCDRLAAWLRQRRRPDRAIAAPSPVQESASRRGQSDESVWREAIARDNETYERPGMRDGQSLRVMQYTGCLYSGGAERQLCNVALGLAQRGHEVRVRTQHALEGEHGHYRPLLDHAGISAGRGGLHRASTQALGRVDWQLLARCPQDIRSYVVNLALELADDPPDILHAWLDHPNVIAALAGIAAKIDCILLSTRNYNPTHFPRFYAPFVDWYRIVAESERVHWLANSHAGAASYAEYVGIDESRFHVVHNGLFVEHFDRPDEDRRRAARRVFDLPAQAPVIAVVNRLDEEKQPELMIKVVTLLLARLPELRVLVAGTGPLEDRVRQIIERRGLGSTIRLLGRVNNVVEVLSAADVLLLTSKYEGCPNVALEAQHIGIPVVATDAGGTRDAVAHGKTGFIRPTDDAPGLVMDLRRILTNPAMRDAFGTAAQGFVDTCFNLDLMVDHTISVYASAMSTEVGAMRRVVTPMPEIRLTNGQADRSEEHADAGANGGPVETPVPVVKIVEHQGSGT